MQLKSNPGNNSAALDQELCAAITYYRGRKLSMAPEATATNQDLLRMESGNREDGWRPNVHHSLGKPTVVLSDSCSHRIRTICRAAAAPVPIHHDLEWQVTSI